jgi:hypothetical protein
MPGNNEIVDFKLHSCMLFCTQVLIDLFMFQSSKFIIWDGTAAEATGPDSGGGQEQ